MSLFYAIQRIEACLAELDSISHSEFPYSDSRAAIDHLKDLFEAQLEYLQEFDEKSDPDVIRLACSISLKALFDYLPILGFILRSTNVRNGFEICRPLLRLSRAILGASNPKAENHVHLLLSSEWEYSPIIYSEIQALPGFVFIGLPATESSNPLIIPLSGHEIGHSLWLYSAKELPKKFNSLVNKGILSALSARIDEYNQFFKGQGATIDDLLNDIFVYQTWAPCSHWACKQAEETFCDFIGLRIFGTAYLYAFAYLISPSFGGVRSYRYPPLLSRVDNLISAANEYQIIVPDNYKAKFDELPKPNGREGDRFLLEIADTSLASIVPDLIKEAHCAIDESKITLSNDAETTKIYERFKKVVPPETTASLADILNAAWMAAEDHNLWNDIPTILSRRESILRELVLKSIEIYDIQQTLMEE